MSTINEISNKLPIAHVNSEKTAKEKTDGNTPSFGNTISEFLRAVNEDQVEAKEGVVDIMTGKSENLHEAMAKVEESKLSFELMLQIRNKLVESFKELQRMPV